MDQLNEIKKTPDQYRAWLKDGTRDTARSILVKSGMEPINIGSGRHGEIYRFDGLDYVLKTFASDDSAYLTWFRFCQTHQHNKYIPKIRGSLVKLNDYYYAVRLEHLIWKNTDALWRYNVSASMRNAEYLTGSLPMPKEDYLRKEVEAVQKNIPELLADPDYLECISFIRSQAKHGFQPDVHAGNFMFRRGQVVLIDALWK